MAIDMAICMILNQNVVSYETILNGGVRWIYQHLLDLMIFCFIRDHPFKTSAYFRGVGVKNLPNLPTDRGKKNADGRR